MKVNVERWERSHGLHNSHCLAFTVYKLFCDALYMVMHSLYSLLLCNIKELYMMTVKI